MKKDICKHGHLKTPENTTIKSNGTRACRICNLERRRIKKCSNDHPYIDDSYKLDSLGRRICLVCINGDGNKKRKTHCKNGHKFTDENTYVAKNGGKVCRKCHAVHQNNRRGNGKIYSLGMTYIEYTRNHAKLYPEIARTRNQRRIARMNKLENTLTANEWKNILRFFKYRCAYCHITEQQAIKKYGRSLAQEHITPVSKRGGYCVQNIVPVCTGCNSRKYTGSPLIPIQPLLLVVIDERAKLKTFYQWDKDAGVSRS